MSKITVLYTTGPVEWLGYQSKAELHAKEFDMTPTALGVWVRGETKSGLVPWSMCEPMCEGNVPAPEWTGPLEVAEEKPRKGASK
jgi:hypothetical protein